MSLPHTDPAVLKRLKCDPITPHYGYCYRWRYKTRKVKIKLACFACQIFIMLHEICILGLISICYMLYRCTKFNSTLYSDPQPQTEPWIQDINIDSDVMATHSACLPIVYLTVGNESLYSDTSSIIWTFFHWRIHSRYSNESLMFHLHLVAHTLFGLYTK